MSFIQSEYEPQSDLGLAYAYWLGLTTGLLLGLTAEDEPQERCVRCGDLTTEGFMVLGAHFPMCERCQ